MAKEKSWWEGPIGWCLKCFLFITAVSHVEDMKLDSTESRAIMGMNGTDPIREQIKFEDCLDPRGREDVKNLGRLESSKKYPSQLVLISHLKVGPLPVILNATEC